MKQNNCRKKSPSSEQIGITGGEQPGKIKKGKKENKVQEESVHMKKKEKEVIMEMGGLDQEVTQGVAVVMRKQPPQFGEDIPSEKGRDLKSHYPQSSMGTEIS